MSYAVEHASRADGGNFIGTDSHAGSGHRPNILQNFPVLTSAIASSAGTTIRGSICRGSAALQFEPAGPRCHKSRGNRHRPPSASRPVHPIERDCMLLRIVSRCVTPRAKPRRPRDQTTQARNAADVALERPCPRTYIAGIYRREVFFCAQRCEPGKRHHLSALVRGAQPEYDS
jgi:hypothetical protein